MFIIIFEKERERMNRSGAGSGGWAGDTESEAGSRLRAVSTELQAGLQLMNWQIMTWAEVGRLTDWVTQEPQIYF